MIEAAVTAAAAAAPDPLGPRIRELFGALAHAGELCPLPVQGPGLERGRVLAGEAGRAAQGTQVRFCLQLSGRQVCQVRYRAYGCPYTLATCEWLARRLSGGTLPAGSLREGLRELLGGVRDWAAALGIPESRLGRLLVIEDALHACCNTASDESMTDSG